MHEQKASAVNAPAALNREALHRELWISWASLLRSYSAAHGLNSGRQAVVETGADEIMLRVADHWIRFTHNQMEDSLGNSLPFSLDENGRARLGDATEEMDLAAEKLAREIMTHE